MPWWGWITIGTLMLAAELAIVDLEFYLVFLGVSALVVGSAELAGITTAWWVQWLAFAALSIGSLVFFRQRVYGALRPPPGDEVKEGVTGDVGVALEPMAPGGNGRVELRGSHWSAVNDGDTPIEEGGRCEVVRSEGLTVRVRPSS